MLLKTGDLFPPGYEKSGLKPGMEMHSSLSSGVKIPFFRDRYSHPGLWFGNRTVHRRSLLFVRH